MEEEEQHFGGEATEASEKHSAPLAVTVLSLLTLTHLLTLQNLPTLDTRREDLLLHRG